MTSWDEITLYYMYNMCLDSTDSDELITVRHDLGIICLKTLYEHKTGWTKPGHYAF